MKKLKLLLFFTCGLLWVQAQVSVVKGKITDETGKSLSGATVIIKGTSEITTTGDDGSFQLATANQLKPVLVISYVGYQTQEYPVKNFTNFIVRLQLDLANLANVVVIGYGTQRKTDMTGASSTVKATEIAKRPLTRLDQALQGTTAGVNVTSPNGQPGAGLRVQIRGANSITGGNGPLYVIDGNIGGGNDVNVNDVESMEILKDAASTAIYGSRGSNGVVLITTKSGKTGKTKINFDTWFRNDKMPRKLDLMGPYDFTRSVNNQFLSTNPTGTAPFTQAQLEDYRTGAVKGTDWQDALHRTALVQNYQLDVSGGNEGVKYYFGLGYLNQPGVILNTWFKRTSFRGNVDVKLNKKMNLKLLTVLTIPQSHNNSYGGGLTDPFNQAVEWDPTSLIRDPNTGDYISNARFASIQFNPIAQAESQSRDNINTNISGSAIFNYKIFEDFTFTSTNVYNIENGYGQIFEGPGTSAFANNIGFAQVNSDRFKNFLTSNFLTYKKRFGDHNFNATALFEYREGSTTSVSAISRNLSTWNLGYYNLGLGGLQQTTSGYNADALVSHMGRIFYSFKDKYTLSASIRSDGSSRLVEKYSSFPSLGVAWNVKKEEFLENSKIFSGLKLRASYGQTGNQAVPPYSSIAAVNTGSVGGLASYFYGANQTGGQVATSLGAVVSQTLQWEKKKTFDAGFDAAFLNGRLNLVVDVYSSEISNLLYNRPNFSYAGGGNTQTNVGELANKGLEIAIEGTPIINSTGFKWTTNFNISFNKNEVVSLGGLADNQIFSNGNNTFNALLKIGAPLGEFYGYKFLGTWKTKDAAEAAKFGMKPGDARFEDVNNDFKYTGADQLRIGNATPDFSWGFINDFEYKNFTMSIMLQGRQGGQIFSQTLAYLWGGVGDMRNATTIEAIPEKLWTATNETDNPAWSSTSKNFNSSSRYVYDASFVKLRNISLNYSVPQKILTKIKMSSLDVYVSGQNLWVNTKFKGYDPEIDFLPTNNAISQGQEFGIIPNPKSMTIGLRIGL
jgi:TonB-linked SusC/RagA family outer membrane protein